MDQKIKTLERQNCSLHLMLQQMCKFDFKKEALSVMVKFLSTEEFRTIDYIHANTGLSHECITLLADASFICDRGLLNGQLAYRINPLLR